MDNAERIQIRQATADQIAEACKDIPDLERTTAIIIAINSALTKYSNKASTAYYFHRIGDRQEEEESKPDINACLKDAVQYELDQASGRATLSHLGSPQMITKKDFDERLPSTEWELLPEAARAAMVETFKKAVTERQGSSSSNTLECLATIAEEQVKSRFSRPSQENRTGGMEERTPEERLIGILSAVYEPVSIRFIANVSRLPTAAVEDFLKSNSDKLTETDGKFRAKPEVIEAQGDLAWAHGIIAKRLLRLSHEEFGLSDNEPKAPPRNDFPRGGGRGGWER